MEADAPSSDVPDEQQPKTEETVVSPPQTISITDGFAPMNQGPMLTGTTQMPSGQLVYLQPPSGAAKVIGIFVIIWGVLFGVLTNGANMLGSLSFGHATLIALDAVNILLGVATVVGGVMLVNYQRRGAMLLFLVLVLGAVVGAAQLSIVVDYDELLEDEQITQQEYDALQQVDAGLVQGIGMVLVVFCNAMCGLMVAIPLMVSNNGLDDSKLFG